MTRIGAISGLCQRAILTTNYYLAGGFPTEDAGMAKERQVYRAVTGG